MKKIQSIAWAFLFTLMGIGILSSCKKLNEVTGHLPTEILTPVSDSVQLKEAVFTELGLVSQGTSSLKIMNRLVTLIDSTPAGANIYLSIFVMDHNDVINALKRADTRGVKLHLEIDMSRAESIADNQPTVLTLQNILSAGAEIIEVRNDAGGSSINHNKFVLFSQVNINGGRAYNVVLQTSHNFTLADSKKIQDGIIITDKGLYTAYLNFWNDIKGKAQTGMAYYTYKEYADNLNGRNAYFFPRRTNGSVLAGDNIIDILNSITNTATATVMVGMSDWTDTRLNIATKLNDLKTLGADVQVVAKSSIDAPVLASLASLQQKGGYVKVFNMTDDTKPKINIHSKFMLIKGMWKGQQSEVVITGTHNYTQNALQTNNETLLVFVNDHDLYNTYLAFYTNIKAL